MFFIQMRMNGEKVYLYNARLMMHLPDYARRFKTAVSALRYMKRHESLNRHAWRIIEIPDEELEDMRYLVWEKQ